VNLRKLDNRPAAIEREVSHAIMVADGYLSQWATFGPRRAVSSVDRPLEGLRVLELGPGTTLGVPVLLACAGAKVVVVDRFLAYWDNDFHPAFMARLLRRVDNRGPRFGDPIRRLLRHNAFTPDVIESFDIAAEELHSLGRTFDLVLSNAVLEHVQDIEITANNLSSATAPGGINFHQVDFRDHRDFNRPLEYLTLNKADFAVLRGTCFCECGCQWRASEVAATFEEAGFDVHTIVNLKTSPEYLAEVRPRLEPEFAALPDEELLATSAFFVLTRVADGTDR
jgi:hypothetical protein